MVQIYECVYLAAEGTGLKSMYTSRYIYTSLCNDKSGVSYVYCAASYTLLRSPLCSVRITILSYRLIVGPSAGMIDEE